jgi:hypothetical protein
VLDDISLYWLTNTATSAARLYWENRNENLISAAAQKTQNITLPVAITAFPNDDLYRPLEAWARRAFPNLIYFNEAEAGGHFPPGKCPACSRWRFAQRSDRCASRREYVAHLG